MPNNFFSFLHKYKKTVLFVFGLITVFFLINALKINIDADYTNLFNNGDSNIYKVEGEFNQEELNLLLSAYDEVKTVDTVKLAQKDIPSGYGENNNFLLPTLNEKEESLEPSENILLMVKSPYFFTPAFLNSLDICLENLQSLSSVESVTSVFDYVTIEKKGTRLKVSPVSPNTNNDLWSNDEVNELKLKIATDPTITGYLVSQKLDAVIFSIDIANISESEIYDLLDQFEPLNEFSTSLAITGNLPINYRIMYYLSHDLTLLLTLSLIIILIIFYISFKAKRSMMLPFSISVVGIIWTFGTMSLLNISINIINLLTPCMVLILGSSYTVHLLSTYYTSYNSGVRKNLSIISTLKIYKTIIFAGLTTIAGFASLLISKVSSLREFGLIVSIGILYCIILSLLFLPLIVSTLPFPTKKQTQTVKKGLLTNVIEKTSRIVMKHWRVFTVLYILIILGFVYTNDKVPVNTNYIDYFPSTDRIGQDTSEISVIFGNDTPYVITITAPEKNDKFFLDPENLAKVYDFETQITKNPDILQNISFSSYVAHLNSLYKGKTQIPTSPALINLFSKLMVIMKSNEAGLISKSISEDSNKLSIYLQTYDSLNNDLATIASGEMLEEIMISALPLLPEECEVEFGGLNAKALRFSNQLMKDQAYSQILAYLLVFIIASLAFKSFYGGLLTLIPVSVGVMANYIIMYLLNIPFDMVTVSFASIAIGAGVDDAIHFLLKYTTLVKDKKLPYKQALSKTLNETGRPIVLTTISIVLGMFMLVFGSYMPIKYLGILLSVALLNSMLATIFVLPSIIIFIETIKSKLFKS